MIVQLSIKKTKIDYFKKLSKEMTKESLQEKGCIEYKIFSNILIDGNFLIYEKYIDFNALEKHKSSKHLAEFTKAIFPYITKEPIIEMF